MKNVKIASKQTLNLMVKEKTLAHPTRLIPILLLIFLVAYAFAQFAVISRLNKVKQAEAELAQMKNNLEMLEASYADFDEVKAEYNRYTYQNYDRTIPDRLDVLALLERRVFNVCTAQSLSIAQRTISMSLVGLTLDDTSALIASLKEEPMVYDVFVSSSSSNVVKGNITVGEGATTTTSITITLNDPTTIVDKTADETAGEDDAGADSNGEQTGGEE